MDVFLEPIYFVLLLPGNLLYPVPKKFAVMSNCYLKYFVPVMKFFRFVQMFQQLLLSIINPNFAYFSYFLCKKNWFTISQLFG